MKIRLSAGLGAIVVAVTAYGADASAVRIGGLPPRAAFTGIPACRMGAACRPSFAGCPPSSSRICARFPGQGGGTFAGGPSDDYAVDADEGFGTDDAFRFDLPTPLRPEKEISPDLTSPSDNY